MELSEILDSLSGPATEKTASYANQSSDSLSAAIDRALSTESFDKVASAESAPAADLMKIAQDLSNSEQSALIKEAHMYGRAVADGFAARMSQYDAEMSKQASYNNDAVFNHAMQRGYEDASNVIAAQGMDKTAEDVKIAAYNQGQEDAVKVASFIQGQEDAVKVASFIQGQEDAVKIASEILKVAGDYEEYGFKVGNQILKRL